MRPRWQTILASNALLSPCVESRDAHEVPEPDEESEREPDGDRRQLEVSGGPAHFDRLRGVLVQAWGDTEQHDDGVMSTEPRVPEGAGFKVRHARIAARGCRPIFGASVARGVVAGCVAGRLAGRLRAVTWGQVSGGTAASRAGDARDRFSYTGNRGTPSRRAGYARRALVQYGRAEAPCRQSARSD